MTGTEWRLERLDAAGLLARADAVFDVKAAALGEPTDPISRRSFREVLERHVARDALRACAAVADADGTLVGFAYGYRGTPGEWWHDIVAGALTQAQAAEWLDDAFEVVELHVLPALQSRGLGSALLTSLLDGVARRTAVLSTRTASTDARAFYAARGWVTLCPALRFSEHDEPYEILGHRLPLAP